MDNYLQNAIGIVSAPLRGRLIQQGFTDDLARLATRDKDYVSKAASAIRKQGGGAAQAMSIGIEEDLAHLYKWAKCNDLVQRDLVFNRATLPNIRNVGTWMDQLEKDTNEDPGKFTTQGKFKALMEKFRQFLSVETNSAGVPILYAIKIGDALPAAADDPGLACLHLMRN